MRKLSILLIATLALTNLLTSCNNDTETLEAIDNELQLKELNQLAVEQRARKPGRPGGNSDNTMNYGEKGQHDRRDLIIPAEIFNNTYIMNRCLDTSLGIGELYFTSKTTDTDWYRFCFYFGEEMTEDIWWFYETLLTVTVYLKDGTNINIYNNFVFYFDDIWSFPKQYMASLDRIEYTFYKSWNEKRMFSIDADKLVMLDVEQYPNLSIGDLYVTEHNHEKGECTLKFYWGDDDKYTRNCNINGHSLYIYFCDSEEWVNGKEIYSLYTPCYQISDTFTIPSEICKRSVTVAFKVLKGDYATTWLKPFISDPTVYYPRNF